MPKDALLYERNHIVIKERSTQSEIRATPLDEITGTITIVEAERGKFFRFAPLGLEAAMVNDWALINGNQSIIECKNDGGSSNAYSASRHTSSLVVKLDSASATSNPMLKYRFHFNLNDLRSVRRHHMLHSIAHMVFILKDGTTLPAFYFNLGGSKELLQKLAQHLRLEK